MKFQRQLLEQRDEFEKAREHEKAAALELGQRKSYVVAKLTKLSITKFNSKVDYWRTFCIKFTSEIHFLSLAKLTKFEPLKKREKRHREIVLDR